MKFLPIAMIAILLFDSGSVSGGIAIHRRDSLPLTQDHPGVYGTDGTLIAPLSVTGVGFSSPSNYFLQSLDFDATSGLLHGLARQTGSAHVLTWDGAGNLVGDVQLQGQPTDSINVGMDFSVHNGVVATHQRDFNHFLSDSPFLYDISGNQIGELSSIGMRFQPGSYYLQSLDFDAATGFLHGLARVSGSGLAQLLSWDATGALLREATLAGYPTDGFNRGLDMTVHDGLIAIHYRDSRRLLFDSPFLYDTRGNQVGTLSTTGISGNPFNYSIQSLDFDANSGLLSGLARDSSRGGSPQWLTWDRNGTLLSEVTLRGFPNDSTNYGLDVAVLSSAPMQAVPEPTAFALWGIGVMIGLPSTRRRQRRA